MTTPFQEDEEVYELLLEKDIDTEDEEDIEANETEVTLEDVEELEEEESVGHKVQTFNPDDDGTDNYFDERYFDE